MPYIITTTTYPPGSPMPNGSKSRAVATLDDAKQAVPIHWNVPEDGAEITLDDGTHIRVQRVSLSHIQRVGHAHPAWTEQQIIDKYNRENA